MSEKKAAEKVSEIDAHISKQYDIVRRLGKGVTFFFQSSRALSRRAVPSGFSPGPSLGPENPENADTRFFSAYARKIK